MYGCCYADASAVMKNYVLKTGRIKLVVINGVMLGMLCVAPEIRYYYRSDFYRLARMERRLCRWTSLSVVSQE